MTLDEHERKRRHRLVQAHMAAENDHDIDAIMATFASKTEMVFNGQRFEDLEQIRSLHIGFGMSSLPGGLHGIRLVPERETFGEEHVLIEARLFATHTGVIQGYPPTNQEVELYYTATYRFDRHGKLASERVVMNFGPITLPYTLSLIQGAQPRL